MRSSTRRGHARQLLTLGAFAATAAMWSGCEAKKQTEYVAGFSTQVKVPRDLKTIGIDISVGGVPTICRTYRVYDGKVQLPRSLGKFPATGKPGPDPITVTVRGFTKDLNEVNAGITNDTCAITLFNVGDSGTRILRRSRQPYVADEVLFLPMPLKFSCFDQTTRCKESETCKGGLCVDAKIDETKLPKYSDDLVDGLGGNCFSASQCFAAGAPAVVVNAADCTYALPNAPPSSPPQLEGAPPNPFPKSGDGVNVEITYDGGLNREILDKDAEEGFTIPDPAKPQQFRLAPGLCNLVKGFGPVTAEAPVDTDQCPLGGCTAHRITALRVSGTCRAKSPYQPLCANDQLAAMGVDQSGISSNPNPPDCKAVQLKPPHAALMVIADDTKNSSLFYDQAAQSAVALQLDDPAFEKTRLGLQLFPGAGTCAAPGSFAAAVGLTIARTAKGQIVDAFKASAANGGALLKPLDTPVNLDGALRDAYAVLGADTVAPNPAYYKRAVLVLGNRGFDQATCGQTPQALAATAKATKNISTYVLMLARNIQVADPATPVPGANELATAGGTGGAYDARTSKANAQDAFQNIVNDIATCVYDAASAQSRPAGGDVLSYTDAIDPAAPTVTIPFNAACNAEAVPGVGFGLDPVNPNRLYFCQASCTAYRNVLTNASKYAALVSQPPIAIPVFAHKAECSPAPGKTSAGSNGGGG